MKLVHAGILKLKLEGDGLERVKAAQAEISDGETLPIAEESLHVTLLHQSALKGVDKLAIASAIAATPAFEVEFDPTPALRTDPEGRRSWVLWVRPEDQSALHGLVSEFCRALGAANVKPEEDRVFHVSLRNRTGKPGDSVR